MTRLLVFFCTRAQTLSRAQQLFLVYRTAASYIAGSQAVHFKSAPLISVNQPMDSPLAIPCTFTIFVRLKIIAVPS